MVSPQYIDDDAKVKNDSPVKIIQEEATGKANEEPKIGLDHLLGRVDEVEDLGEDLNVPKIRDGLSFGSELPARQIALDESRSTQEVSKHSSRISLEIEVPDGSNKNIESENK
ncbi:hypothetical protein K7X08_023834 [Anisodus acutangulus]|uniref:Uncharacterized protein n=1 Tax=Anisodus acutangulus TaxID=402998 RepID=A0A9Q1QXX2_9SOLA|nr:hypothetical protein K7X08_023834 [Anisodus acutangulus]